MEWRQISNKLFKKDHEGKIDENTNKNLHKLTKCDQDGKIDQNTNKNVQIGQRVSGQIQNVKIG